MNNNTNNIDSVHVAHHGFLGKYKFKISLDDEFDDEFDVRGTETFRNIIKNIIRLFFL